MSVPGIELEYPAYVSLPSKWLGHVPFAFWVIEAQKPRTVVELGLGSGNSYCAFLQAARALHLETTFLGIAVVHEPELGGAPDTLRAYHDPRYAAVSRLVQWSLDDALANVADRSIDLLHISGTHIGEVARRLDAWLPKMSSRGLILLHGIEHIRELRAFWDALASRFPCFSFVHEYSLGVAYVGDEPLPARCESLLRARDSDAIAQTRAYFARLGISVSERSALAQANAEIVRLKTQLEAGPPPPASEQPSTHAGRAMDTQRDIAIRLLRQQTLDLMRFERERSTMVRKRVWSYAVRRTPEGLKRFVPLRMKRLLERLLAGR